MYINILKRSNNIKNGHHTVTVYIQIATTTTSFATTAHSVFCSLEHGSWHPNHKWSELQSSSQEKYWNWHYFLLYPLQVLPLTSNCSVLLCVILASALEWHLPFLFLTMLAASEPTAASMSSGSMSSNQISALNRKTKSLLVVFHQMFSTAWLSNLPSILHTKPAVLC